MTTEQINAYTTQLTAAEGFRAVQVIVRDDGATVIFGYPFTTIRDPKNMKALPKHIEGKFQADEYTPARNYKNEANAMKAARKWVGV